jgi:hypothetical protein
LENLCVRKLFKTQDYDLIERNVVKRYSVCFNIIIPLASVSAITALILSTTTDTIHIHAQVGTGTQNIKATYSVEIVPGASQKTNLIHYYPARIAVPVGTTVTWSNNESRTTSYRN